MSHMPFWLAKTPEMIAMDIKQSNSRLYAHVTGAAGRVLMTKTLQHAERRGDPTRPHTPLRR